MERINHFCDSVLGCIPRATRREKDGIRDELLDHLLEHKDVLMGYGLDEAEAEKQAVAAMGDAEGIGKAWNEKLSPFWLWLGRVCMVCCVLLVLSTALRSEYRLKMIWNVWQVQRGQETVELDEISSFDLVWEKDPGVCEEFGLHMVCIPKIALWKSTNGKDRYELQLYAITYPREVTGYPLPLGPIMHGLETNPESRGGGGAQFEQQGYSEARHQIPIEKGTEKVVLDLEYNGETFHAEIPLDWEGV